MASIVFNEFKGMVPRIDPHLLPDGYAQTATNAKLIRNIIQAWKNPTTVRATTTGINTIFRYVVSSTENWLCFSNDTPILYNVAPGDTKQTVIWLVNGELRHSRNDKLVFTSNYVKDTSAYFKLGVPAPTDAPKVVISGAIPSSVEARSYVYAWVYRNTIGGKSNTIEVEVDTDQIVKFNGLDDVPPATVNGIPRPASAFKKFIFFVDSATDRYGLVARCDWTATSVTVPSNKIIKQYKSTAFKASKITAPASPTDIVSLTDLSSTTNWTAGTGWTHGATTYAHAGPSAGDLTYALAGLTIGQQYDAYFTTANQTVGALTVKQDSTTIKSSIQENGPHVATFTATATSHNIVFSADATCDVTLNNLRVVLRDVYAVAEIDPAEVLKKGQRRYVYCWLYLSGGVWKRTTESAAASISDVKDGDSVIVSNMTASSGLASTVKGVRKMVFRTDAAGNYRRVGRIPNVQTFLTDNVLNKKLGPKITHWPIGTAGSYAAPTVSLNTDDSTDVTKESRFYEYTFVTAWGEESAPSPISAQMDVLPWQSVTITSDTTAPTGYSNITAKRFYRTDSTGEYRLVFEEDTDLATASVDDDVETEDLGEPIPSVTWDVPPTSVTWAAQLPNGVICVVWGNQVGFSEPNYPYAYPIANQFQIDYDVVGCAVSDNGVVITTQGNPYLCTGSDPASMVPLKLKSEQSCLAATTMAVINGNVVYASPDGLVAINGPNEELVTEGVITRDQWQAYVYQTNGAVASVLKAYAYERRYILFYNNGTTSGALIFDFNEKTFSTTATTPTAGYSDLRTDKLYLQIGSNIQSWDTGSALTYTWKSKRVLLDKAINPAFARVDASSYPVTFKLYADGVLKHTQTVASIRAFALPAGYRAFDFEIEFSGTSDIRHAVLATKSEELQ